MDRRASAEPVLTAPLVFALVTCVVAAIIVAGVWSLFATPAHVLEYMSLTVTFGVVYIGPFVVAGRIRVLRRREAVAAEAAAAEDEEALAVVAAVAPVAPAELERTEPAADAPEEAPVVPEEQHRQAG